MLSITLDDRTTLELENLARVRSADPVTLAQEMIRARLRDEARRAMEQEVETFRSLHADLMASIPGEYAAICQGKLVDHDEDQLALLQRIEERYPGLPVLSRQVRPEVDTVIEIRSPRFDNA